MLRYDATSRRYVGRSLSVSEGAFLRVLRRLLATERDTDEIIRDLLDEGRWSVAMPGVMHHLDAAAVLAEAETVLRHTDQA
jgi:hypothetical protein